MSNKWKIFHKPINANLDFAIQVVKTCSSLHNYVRVRDGINIQNVMSVTGFVDAEQDGGTTSTTNQ